MIYLSVIPYMDDFCNSSSTLANEQLSFLRWPISPLDAKIKPRSQRNSQMFSRFSAKLGPRRPWNQLRPGHSSIRIDFQPRRPILRPWVSVLVAQVYAGPGSTLGDRPGSSGPIFPHLVHTRWP